MTERIVYFDLGNVLVHFDHDIALSRLEGVTGQPRERIRRAIFESGVQDRYETGLIDDPQFTQQICRELDCSIEQPVLLEAISDIFSINEEILPVLEQVRRASVRTAILSNTCRAHWQWIVRQGWAIPGEWFQFQVLSYEVRSMKPAAEIYEYCERRAECRGADIYFTDDRAENVAAAAQRGWRAHQFVSAARLEEDLLPWLSG